MTHSKGKKPSLYRRSRERDTKQRMADGDWMADVLEVAYRAGWVPSGLDPRTGKPWKIKGRDE